MSKLAFLFLIVIGCNSFTQAQNDYHKFEVSGGYSHNFTVCCISSYQSSEVDVQFFSNGVPVPGIYTAITGTFDFSKRTNFKGFNASATYNFSKYIGATVDFSGHYGKGDLILSGGRATPALNSSSPQIIASPHNAPQRIYNYMGGVQFKNNSTNKKFKPFAHALFGVSRQSSEYPAGADDRIRRIYFANGDNKIRNSGFSMAFGGGLDVSVSKRIDIRIVKFDYNPVFLKDKTITGSDPTNSVLGATAGFPGYRQNNFRLGFGIVLH